MSFNSGNVLICRTFYFSIMVISQVYMWWRVSSVLELRYHKFWDISLIPKRYYCMMSSVKRGTLQMSVLKLNHDLVIMTLQSL